ncbi:MAG: SDR family oxidoreductase [Bacteroidetes bacterium]|nr:SDR family oxidoreductase [Bacteroidota bacterium]
MKAIITGASKGMGKAIATKLVTQGFDIAICARDKNQLQQTVNELQALNSQATIFYEVRDISNKQEAINFGKSVLQELKQVDLLINNAGTFIPGQISNEEDGILEKLMSTNVYSAYHLTRSVIDSMKSNALQNGSRGHIFNISSVAALKAYSHGGSYSISKYALEGFSKNLREELKEDFIKVTTVNPGATMSDSWNGSGVDEARIMKPEDIADMIWAIYNLSPQAVVEEIVLRPQLGDL